MEGTYTKNGWQQTTQKHFNYKLEGRINIWRPLTRWGDYFLEDRGISIVDDDDEAYILFLSKKKSILSIESVNSESSSLSYKNYYLQWSLFSTLHRWHISMLVFLAFAAKPIFFNHLIMHQYFIIKFDIPKKLAKLMKTCLDGTRRKVRRRYLLSRFPKSRIVLNREVPCQNYCSMFL